MMVFKIFFYQPTLDTLELKKDRGSDYVLSWKSKGVFTSKFEPLHTSFLHSTDLSGYKVGIRFDKDLLPVDQNNYTTKIVNAYNFYELNSWPRNTVNFKLKKLLF